MDMTVRSQVVRPSKGYLREASLLAIMGADSVDSAPDGELQ